MDTISLEVNLPADLLTLLRISQIGDDLGRSHASRLGLSIKGSAGILLAAYQAGLITNLQETLDELRAKGFHLSDRVYYAILAQAGK